MSEEDANILAEKSKKQGVSESSYVRMLIRDRPIDDKHIHEQLLKLNYEINRQGNNINQIAKKWNTDLYGVNDYAKLLTYMRRTEKLILEVIAYCNQ